MIVADGSYPMLSLMWTTLVFCSWILWFWLLIMMYADIFKRRDIGAGAKTGWVALALLLPFVGVFIYLISQGHSMGERRAQEAQQQKAELDAYVRSVAASSPTSGQSGVAQLEKAHDLMRSGALTPEEYEALKKKVLV